MYSRKKANVKTGQETVEGATSILLTVAAAKLTPMVGVELTPEALLILASAVKVLIARVRNKIKHSRRAENE